MESKLVKVNLVSTEEAEGLPTDKIAVILDEEDNKENADIRHIRETLDALKVKFDKLYEAVIGPEE